jgi:hypothetical protein
MDKTYAFDGLLIGLYYDENGAETAALAKVRELEAEGKRLKALEKSLEQRMPPCNSRWSSNADGAVWCSTDSGGIRRDWVC